VAAPRSRTGVRSSVAQHGSGREAEHATAPGVVVVRITHQDVPEICALFKRVWDAPPVPDIPGELLKSWQPTPLEFTSGMEGVTYFAARRDGRLIGAIGCEVDHGSCRLLHLAVDSDARRAGVASALLGAAVEWARHSNATVVWGSALARFSAIPGLLKRLEFTECGLLHRHEWGEDVRLFERLL
jgi:GNAT superfamily N-acetyltransferase